MTTDIQTTEITTFGFPVDFPSLEDSVVGSLKKGYRDYCFKDRQLNEIIEKCHNANVSFVYQKKIDDDFKYYELTPCCFYFAKTTDDNKVDNIQVDIEHLPAALIFCPYNIKAEEEGIVNEKRVSKNKKLAYFDDNGYPVYIEDLKRMRKEKEEKENGI